MSKQMQPSWLDTGTGGKNKNIDKYEKLDQIGSSWFVLGIDFAPELH